jgi:hypothetical protein
MNEDNVLFSFSLDRVSSYIMLITGTFTKIGVMPFGGNPVGSYCVSLLGMGFYYFDLEYAGYDSGYVGEKLNISNKEDAKSVRIMLNAIGLELRELMNGSLKIKGES